MELLLFLAVALLPPFALLAVSRKAFGVTVCVVAILLVLGAIYSWQLNDTCFSDGCIGAIIFGGFTVLMAIASFAAGAIRWTVIDVKDRRDGGRGLDL